MVLKNVDQDNTVSKIEVRRHSSENIGLSKSSLNEQSQAVLRRSREGEGPSRSVSECLRVFKSTGGAAELSDDEIILLVEANHIQARNLEKDLKDFQRGVLIR